MIRRYWLWFVLFILIFTIGACAPAPTTPQPAGPTAATGEPVEAPTQTLPAAAPTNTPAPVIPTETATEVPLIPTETSSPTATVAPTATPRPRGTAATPRPRNTVAPLIVSYQTVEIKRLPGDQATLVLNVMATGGNGVYRYYHDDIQQTSATFNVAGICGKPFVHTITVISGDGQTVAMPYHVSGVCPTPTP